MTHSISDLTSRLRNAYAARLMQVRMPHSRLNQAVATVLSEAGYLGAVSKEGSAPFQELVLELKYHNTKTPVVSGIRLLSTPGRRLYSSAQDLPKTLGGYGITIISTNKGVLTDAQARQQNVGGELLCQVW